MRASKFLAAGIYKHESERSREQPEAFQAPHQDSAPDHSYIHRSQAGTCSSLAYSNVIGGGGILASNPQSEVNPLPNAAPPSKGARTHPTEYSLMYPPLRCQVGVLPCNSHKQVQSEDIHDQFLTLTAPLSQGSSHDAFPSERMCDSSRWRTRNSVNHRKRGSADLGAIALPSPEAARSAALMVAAPGNSFMSFGSSPYGDSQSAPISTSDSLPGSAAGYMMSDSGNTGPVKSRSSLRASRRGKNAELRSPLKVGGAVGHLGRNFKTLKSRLSNNSRNGRIKRFNFASDNTSDYSPQVPPQPTSTAAQLPPLTAIEGPLTVLPALPQGGIQNSAAQQHEHYMAEQMEDRPQTTCDVGKSLPSTVTHSASPPAGPHQHKIRNDSLYAGHSCARSRLSCGFVGQFPQDEEDPNMKKMRFAVKQFEKELKNRLAAQGVEGGPEHDTSLPEVGLRSTMRWQVSPRLYLQGNQERRVIEQSFSDKERLEESTLQALAACMKTPRVRSEGN